MLTTNEIGGKIAVARKLKNISQAELAEQLSVSAQAVGKWERGESMPDIIMFSRLAAVLGTDLNYYTGGISDTPYTQMPVIQNVLHSANEESKKTGWNMSGGMWKDADFSGLHGLAEKFKNANIEKCRFVESEMSGLELKGSNIQRSDFSRSDLTACNFSGVNIEHSIFVGCDFSGSEFIKSHVNDCDFSDANLTGVRFNWCYFNKTTQAGAVFRQIKFEHGTFTGMTFTGELTDCSFENSGFVRTVFDGAVLRNCFFKNSRLKRIKFIGCRADRLTYAFMKNCKADLSDVTIIEY